VSLKNRVMDDLKTAMKAQDKLRMSVIRMVLSEIKYAQAAENIKEELSDEAIAKVVGAYQKRLVKSRDEYPDPAKVAQIDAEIKIVEEYLPKRAGTDDVKAAIQEILNSTPERNFGLLMKQVMAKLGAAADGKVVSQLLKESLS